MNSPQGACHGSTRFRRTDVNVRRSWSHRMAKPVTAATNRNGRNRPAALRRFIYDNGLCYPQGISNVHNRRSIPPRDLQLFSGVSVGLVAQVTSAPRRRFVTHNTGLHSFRFAERGAAP